MPRQPRDNGALNSRGSSKPCSGVAAFAPATNYTPSAFVQAAQTLTAVAHRAAGQQTSRRQSKNAADFAPAKQNHAKASATSDTDTISSTMPKMIFIQNPSIFLEKFAPKNAPGIEPIAIKAP